MPRFTPILAAAVVSSAAFPASARPDSVLDLFTLDRIATVGVQWSISMLRSFAETRYVDLSIAPLDGRMVLTGLEVSPYEWNGSGQCTFDIDRAVINTGPLDKIEQSRMRLDLTGVTLSEGCLDDMVVATIQAVGVEELKLDSATLWMQYDMPTGGVSLELQAASQGLAEIRAQMDFDYFAFDAQNEEPIADLSYAELSFIDHGAMAILGQMLPPELTNAEMLAAALKQELLSGVMSDDGIPHQKSKSRLGGGEAEISPAPAPDPTPQAQPEPEPTPNLDDEFGDEYGDDDDFEWDFEEPDFYDDPELPPLSEEDIASVAAMIDDGAAQFAAFLADPDQITLRLAPATPVRLSENTVDDFARFALLMQPEVITGTPPVAQVVTGADMEAIKGWLDGDEAALASSDALRIARAFMTGIGVPRDADMAMQIVAPLLAKGDSDAVALALDGLDALPADQAYRIARDAAASGNRAAFTRLDKLEQKLGLAEAIAIQDASPLAPALTGDETPAQLRNAALDALTGLDAPRRYSLAYYDALLALAAGDRAAQALIDEVEAMSERMADADASDWAETLTAIRAQATKAWIAAH